MREERMPTEVDNLIQRFENLKRPSGVLKALPDHLHCKYGDALLADLTSFLESDESSSSRIRTLTSELEVAKAEIAQLERANIDLHDQLASLEEDLDNIMSSGPLERWLRSIARHAKISRIAGG